MKVIPLVGNVYYTKVDDKWFELMVQWGPWYAIQKRPGGSCYARNAGGVYMQNLIMNAGPNKTVDHINLNTLDNQESNLRPATVSQQTVNRRARSDSTTGVPGISWDKTAKQFRVYTNKNGKRFCLGLRKNFGDALALRNQGAVEVHGEFTRIFDVNGESSTPNVNGASLTPETSLLSGDNSHLSARPRMSRAASDREEQKREEKLLSADDIDDLLN